MAFIPGKFELNYAHSHSVAQQFLREIKFHKNQYGPASGSVFARYANGLFLPVEGMTMDAAEREAKADALFLDLLKKFTAQGQMVSPNPSAAYAPARFAEHSDAAGFTRKELGKAMQRLLDAGQIEIRTWGRPSRPVKFLAVAEQK